MQALPARLVARVGRVRMLSLQLRTVPRICRSNKYPSGTLVSVVTRRGVVDDDAALLAVAYVGRAGRCCRRRPLRVCTQPRTCRTSSVHASLSTQEWSGSTRRSQNCRRRWCDVVVLADDRGVPPRRLVAGVADRAGIVVVAGGVRQTATLEDVRQAPCRTRRWCQAACRCIDFRRGRPARSQMSVVHRLCRRRPKPCRHARQALVAGSTGVVVVTGIEFGRSLARGHDLLCMKHSSAVHGYCRRSSSCG
jgi:hypothetical protein